MTENKQDTYVVTTTTDEGGAVIVDGHCNTASLQVHLGDGVPWSEALEMARGMVVPGQRGPGCIGIHNCRTGELHVLSEID